MLTFIINNLQVSVALLIFILAAIWLIWPRLKRVGRTEALTWLLLFSALRIYGSGFLVPELSPNLPASFAIPQGYGDIISTALALSAAILVRSAPGLGTIMAWVYGIWGSLDFMNGIRLSGPATHVVNGLGTNWFVLAIGGPVWIATLGLLFATLVRTPAESGSRR